MSWPPWGGVLLVIVLPLPVLSFTRAPALQVPLSVVMLPGTRTTAGQKAEQGHEVLPLLRASHCLPSLAETTPATS